MGFIFPYWVKVINVEFINDNVVLLKIEKPFRFEFELGQVVDMSINKEGYDLSVSSFTIANTPAEEHLEFIIKIYPRKGLTEAISRLQTNDVVQISSPWNSYAYKGKGTFIAAGAGITAFLPIFKTIKSKGVDLKQGHSLIYADKSKTDVLYYKNLKGMFNNKLSVILSRAKSKNLSYGKVDGNYLSNIICSTEQYFYICGPKKFEKDIKSHLVTIGVKRSKIQTGYKI
ncbi:FAD-binding oxidoreductase [Aequorivita marina]|uniref:FAD-binding oxidoreductase n=1 Tax=Aequorivita marina TaxID=3073654 RepID=UPI002875E4A7|nr:FAD-binding oxidoreductase [Aequorivita sp. S2608]MDS1298141.1 FAD-binding oxidoreductase [Aequorivita sp. S2608]